MPTSRPTRKNIPAATEMRFRPRIHHRGEIALGPGKADLLAAIQGHGSISRAAGSLGMSYMRAWTLVKIMNQSFRGPLVEVDRGGPQGGAAHLTPLGQEVLMLYQSLVDESEKTTRPIWARLRRRLK